MAKAATQTLMLDTLAGPKPILAPAGWKFDKTAVIVWSQLLWRTRQARQTPPKLKREQAALAGVICELSNILANALGMALPYWEGQAREIIDLEC